MRERQRMNERNQETLEEMANETNSTLSRRTLTGSFGLALVALMSGPALFQTRERASESRQTFPAENCLSGPKSTKSLITVLGLVTLLV